MLEQLYESSKKYDLSNEGFVQAIFTPHSFDKDQACFPHIYETPETMEMLKEKMKLTPAPQGVQKKK
jgi:hypothetical protein